MNASVGETNLSSRCLEGSSHTSTILEGGVNGAQGEGDGSEAEGPTVEIWNHKHNRQIILTGPDWPGVFCVDRNNDPQDFFGTFPNLIDKFVVEQTGRWVGTPFYSLRAKGTNRYLTVEMYGDEQRLALEQVIGNIPHILPDHISKIGSYVVHPDLEGSHEGPGYHNWPIQAHPGPPNALQVFRLCREDHLGIETETGDIGLMPYWGSSYLRCLPWGNYVSQSPILDADEQWNLIQVEDESEEEEEE